MENSGQSQWELASEVKNVQHGPLQRIMNKFCDTSEKWLQSIGENGITKIGRLKLEREKNTAREEKREMEGERDRTREEKREILSPLPHFVFSGARLELGH